MDRISSLNNYGSIVANLMAAEARQADAQGMVSSGKIASDLKGFGGSASEQIVAAQSLKTRVDGYVTNAAMLSAKLDTQDLALNQVADAAQGARAAIANAVATGNGIGLSETLQSFFSQAVSGLNTQYAGRYLFAGGQVNTPPVAAGQMADLTAAPSTASLFKNDTLATVTQVDDSTALKTGMLASDLGQPLFDAFKTAQAFLQSVGPINGPLTQAQSDALTNMLSSFDSAHTGLTAAAAQNGVNQQRVTNIQQVQTDRQTMLETTLGGLTDADMAKAATRLTQAQTAVQASAQVFAMLQGSSLLNLLK